MGFSRIGCADSILALVLGSIVLATLIALAAHQIHTDQRKARVAGLPLPVQTMPATVTTLQETVGASGTIQPSMPVRMTAKVVGRALTVPVDLGSVVRPGDLLVQIDPRLYRAEAEAAKINYAYARAQLQRLDNLLRQNYASLADVEKAHASVAAAREEEVRTAINLADSLVRSPVPAVVLDRTINPGETTRVDQELFKLGVLDPIMMVAEVSEDKAGWVRLGMAAEVGTDAFPGETFTGRVAKIEAAVNDATRTFGAYIEIGNHGLRLKQGVTGYARLIADRMALAVPSTALMNPVGDRASVFVVGEDGRAHLREVRRGLMVAGMTELLNGVREGESIVTVGQLDLHDNDKVATNQYGSWNQK
jgi:membrane fusion protein, multidrug efflux system